MKFNVYKKEFIEKASENLDIETINNYLEYAENLYKKDLPIIYDPLHFSELVGYKIDFLYSISNSQSSFYRKFKIKKKSGGHRIINAPLPSLKEIQNWILKNILYKIKCSKYSKAFKSKTSIKNHARFHKNKKFVLNVDIEDYFDNIKLSKIITFFISLGYSKNLSILLSNLCTFKNKLPQGAPTSPYLSNLITIKLDNELFEITKIFSPNLSYSRYADDITFSGNLFKNVILNRIFKVLNKHGFKINNKKIRVQNSNNRQVVTGLTVNETLNVNKNYRKEIRKLCYYIKKFGLENHMNKLGIQNDKLTYMQKILGKINFILYINPNDKDMKKNKEEMIKILINYKREIYKPSV